MILDMSIESKIQVKIAHSKKCDKSLLFKSIYSIQDNLFDLVLTQ